MNTKKNDNYLITEPIPKLIVHLAAPASIGYFFNTMYNVVDTYFSGQLSTQALAALSISFPVFFIILALGSGISTGATALIAGALGAGDKEKARLLAIQAVSFGFIVSIVITIFGLTASPFLFGILGAEGEYLDIALEYMNTIFSFSVFFMIVFMFNSILNATGDTKTFRNFLIVGFIMNVILDPWFIYGGLGLPPMKFTGVALATVFVQIVGCIYLGFRVVRTGMVGADSIKNLVPKADMFKDIARQGFPASINMGTIGMGMFVITYFVSQFGKEGVAAYGVGMRIEQIILMPTIGLNIATLTLVAQNDGAGKYDRVIEVVGTALKYGAYMMAAGGLLLIIAAGFMMRFFADNPDVIRIGTTYLRIDALVLYAYVVLFVNVAALQGLKKPMFAVWMGLYRQIAAPMAVFYLFSHVFGWGVTGIWWGIFVVTWSGAVFTFFYAGGVIKNTIKRKRIDGASSS